MFRHVRHATGQSINVADIAGSWPEKLGAACCILSSLCHECQESALHSKKYVLADFVVYKWLSPRCDTVDRSIDVDPVISIESTRSLVQPPDTLSYTIHRFTIPILAHTCKISNAINRGNIAIRASWWAFDEIFTYFTEFLSFFSPFLSLQWNEKGRTLSKRNR